MSAVVVFGGKCVGGQMSGHALPRASLRPMADADNVLTYASNTCSLDG